MKYEFSVEVSGDTVDDIVEAMREATSRIAEGNILGSDRNETAQFSFNGVAKS